jgi:glycosyltransferase involved in cell wall biosynthesis
MRIQLITRSPRSGSDEAAVAARRWDCIFRSLGHRVEVAARYRGRPADLLVTIEASPHADSIRRFHNEQSCSPIVIMLGSNEAYRDLESEKGLLELLDLATRLVVTQGRTGVSFPPYLRRKTWLIHQSSLPLVRQPRQPGDSFQVCVVGHQQPGDDAFRLAQAVRALPESSRVQVIHVGQTDSDPLEQRAQEESRKNDRYKWLGSRSHAQVRRLIAGSHLLAITPRREGALSGLSEAVMSAVPVVTSRLYGPRGVLGDDYLGYFPPGDTGALAELIQKAETDSAFYGELKAQCKRAARYLHPERERAALRDLLEELGPYSNRP